MLRLLRHALFLLVAVAFVGGTTTNFARSAQYGSTLAGTAMPCDMAMPASASGDTKSMQPCKGIITPDCIKLMGCVSVNALPVHFLTHESTIQYSEIDYWTSVSKLDSLDPEPEPLPPRTA
ncbi:MAG: hypothetical protein WDN69_29640 [Aliidongia sp.]